MNKQQLYLFMVTYFKIYVHYCYIYCLILMFFE